MSSPNVSDIQSLFVPAFIERTSEDRILTSFSKINGLFPEPALEQQAARFCRAMSIIAEGIAAQAFPSVSFAVTFQGRLIALEALGRFTYDSSSPAVNRETIYDLASLSKVLATTTMAMILYERGELDLDMPVRNIIADFAGDDARRDQITMRHLLAHSSGLPAYEKLFERAHSAEQLFRAACTIPLVRRPGEGAEYSDIGFIILGEALARIADQSLDRFCQREIFGPLGMGRTTFNPPQSWRALIPPTVDDRHFRHRIIQGEVHDENASLLGGVAGHAGLFSSAADVATFAHTILNGGFPILRPETIALFSRRERCSQGNLRALGWDTPSSPSQSGKYFSLRSLGHLGYTGTSLWIDPERQLSVTLLTNRSWPDDGNQAIKVFRPRFHDAIVEAVTENV